MEQIGFAGDRMVGMGDEGRDACRGCFLNMPGAAGKGQAARQVVRQAADTFELKRAVAAVFELEALRKQLFDEKKLTEKQKLRIAELEERDSTRVAGEQQLKKEIDRLTEQLKKRDQRESELTQAVKPALMRIAELTRELEHTRLQLATTEADLTDLKRGGRR